MAVLLARLQEQDAALVLLGEPSAIQEVPLAYLMGYQSDYRREIGGAIIDARPRMRIVVRWQDAPNAEQELLALVDSFAALLDDARLEGVCRVSIEQILYGYLSVAGTRYRMAQLALLLVQL